MNFLSRFYRSFRKKGKETTRPDSSSKMPPTSSHLEPCSSETDDKFLMVLAMDFGTAYSGYAYSFTHDHTKVIADIKWAAGSTTLMSFKTPTCVLLNPQQEFEYFGYEAEDRLADLAGSESEDPKEWYFFEHFKMALHNNQGLKRDTMIEDVNGKFMPALTIIKMSIKYLKDHFMKNMKSVDSIRQEDIRFVITVPAIWDDMAKQFMREAAIQAGIDGNSLMLALEPEAASIWCQNLPIEKICDSKGTHISIAETGTQYMVVDLGGGTADITVHEKQKDGKLKELHPASGGPWGGGAVDKEFKEFLASIVGQDIMKKFAKEQTEDFIYLMREFETKKRAISSQTSGMVTIKVPVSLKNTYKESGKNLKEMLAVSSQEKGLKWVADKCRFQADTVKNFFNDPCKRLVDHMKELFSHPNLSNVSTILLVGGFAECKLVQETIEKEFGEKRILVPSECGLAVLKGAVLFGHKPTTISSRVARFTYGKGTNVPFDATIHPEKYRGKPGVDEGHCFKAFFPFVKIDDDLPIGRAVTTRYVHPRQTDTVESSLYISTSRDPKFTDDSSCRLIGRYRYPIYNKGNEEERAVSQTIIFGDTELKFKIKQEKTGEEHCTNFLLP